MRLVVAAVVVVVRFQLPLTQYLLLGTATNELSAVRSHIEL